MKNFLGLVSRSHSTLFGPTTASLVVKSTSVRLISPLAPFTPLIQCAPFFFFPNVFSEHANIFFLLSN
uniref:Uncharacterized protein n=1 Tax=Caenorhabditis tropicalis TaxID=1561998 RepID=A0A1I7TLF1_9PELO